MFKLTNFNICIKEIDHLQGCDKKVDHLVTRELSIYKSVHLKAFQCPRNAKLFQANVLELPEILFKKSYHAPPLPPNTDLYCSKSFPQKRGPHLDTSRRLQTSWRQPTLKHNNNNAKKSLGQIFQNFYQRCKRGEQMPGHVYLTSTSPV